MAEYAILLYAPVSDVEAEPAPASPSLAALAGDPAR
jgi:hypothetical protein